jgi:excisionase family DNA binding protein
VGEHGPERDREQWLTLAEAAEVLGLSKDGVRMRVRRGTLRSEKGGDGRVYVFVDVTTHETAAEESQASVEGSRELVEVLRAQVEDLQRRLDRETEANREHRRLLAAALERIPEIEAPSSAEPREGDLHAEAEEPSSTPTEPRPTPEEAATRPWWRRIFGE